MSPKPFPRPRPLPAATAPSRTPAVAIRIAARHSEFCFYATTGTRSWQGVTSAPTRESALLDLFGTVRADLGTEETIRFVLALRPDSPLWQHYTELVALGYRVERADFHARPLMAAAQAGLAALLSQLPPRPANRDGAPEPAVPAPAGAAEELTVATDGSVRKTHAAGRTRIPFLEDSPSR